MTNQLQIQQPNNLKVRFLALLAGLALAFKNFGAFFFKGGWLLKTGLTTLLSFAVYSSVYGWRFAMVLIGMLIIHEFGHWIWLKANGVAAEVPIFIPFVGAIISLRKLPPNEITTGWTALAGPLIGGAGALLCWILGFYLNNGPLMAGASFGFMLNLFQLIPAMPLDGAWVLANISRVLLIPGTLILILLAILSLSPLLCIISVIAVISLFSKKKVEPLIDAVQPVKTIKTIGEIEAELVGEGKEASHASASSGSAGVTAVVPPVSTANNKTNRRNSKFDMERLALFSAYLILTGLLGFMSVDSVAVLNERLHIKNPLAYLKGHEESTKDQPGRAENPSKSLP